MISNHITNLNLTTIGNYKVITDNAKFTIQASSSILLPPEITKTNLICAIIVGATNSYSDWATVVVDNNYKGVWYHSSRYSSQVINVTWQNNQMLITATGMTWFYGGYGLVAAYVYYF